MPRRLILILVALLISGVAIYLARTLPRGSGHDHGASAPANAHPTVQVLVAKTDLYVGDFVTAANLTWQAWPDGVVPADYAAAPRARMQDFIGAIVTSRLAPGDPITPAHLVRPGDRGFLAAVLQPGDRAVTVNVTPSTGMAGFLYPGDRVDLILTQTISSTGPNTATRHVSETLLHGIRVVGLDQSLTDKRDDKKVPLVPKTATLEVSPKQAEIVAVASDLGVLTLSLNSLAGAHDAPPSDAVTKTWDMEATQLASETSRPTPHATPPRSTWTVDVVRGGVSNQALPPGGPHLRPDPTP